MTRTDGPRPLRGYLLAALAAACWATGGLTADWLFTSPSAATAAWIIPPLGISVEPPALSGARALAAFVLLAVYLATFRRKDLAVSVRDLPFLAVFGVAGLALVHFTYFKTISITGNPATAILLEYMAPVLVLLVSVLFLGQRFRWSLPIGVALSVAGCALVVGVFGGAGPAIPLEGVLWGLLSAVFFAGYSLIGSVAAKRFTPYTLLVWGLLFAALFWLLVLGPAPVLALFAEPKTALAVLFIAVVSTIVPFGAFLTALHHIPPTNATVTSTIEPVLAAIGAYLLMGKALSFSQILGGALVLVAIVIIQRREAPQPEVPPLGV
ncbi:MAG: DMT family transporter [Coriobacteriia bacterium]|nr:DMT family transporter [Coriobacteriia bacterium]